MTRTSLYRNGLAIAVTAALFLICLAPILSAQEQPSWDYSGHTIPSVAINDRAISLQAGLFPEYYRTHSARTDLRWVRQQDSSITVFWNNYGAMILDLLSQNGGISWVERDFDIYLVRYYHSIGEAEPMIIPIGGVRTGSVVKAAPTDANMQFLLIYQMARRLLAQADRPEEGVHLSVADHPLMQPGPYRRNNLAMLLALVTAQQVMGLDATFDAYQSGFWQNHHPGRAIFEQYMLKDWILTPERPLAVWVGGEPYGSQLVTSTRPPRRAKPDDNAGMVQIEGLPLKGTLGFSVKTDDRGRLVVDKLDPNRLAFACGLQEGDVVRQVDGARVRTHKDIISQILTGLDNGGASVNILRDGQGITLIIQPMAENLYDESIFYDEEVDTLESMPPMPEYIDDDSL